MLLKLETSKVPMKMVFLLSKELKNNPERVALTQALTLDKSKPTMGLKGTNGLFGSKEWWNSIEQGRIPLLFISGIIKKAYVAGQDPSNFNNTVDLLLEDGTIQSVGIYTNKKEDSKLFKIGYSASIVYALDEMKLQPDFDGKINRSKTALEMTVSLEPVE
ncbi:hypothetical protein A9G42_07365 [Gilliamella sp. Nev6-6]|uniref:hypothetical protein n=2 Tax=unclassified Gilliamella TaxID=2685620 RepID=UPI00080F59B9|nr:hypothetical protein [Gilliamella apicola]OCG76680.1 hypothetical protein A9G42_07365 [Gilliamella apicola]